MTELEQEQEQTQEQDGATIAPDEFEGEDREPDGADVIEGDDGDTQPDDGDEPEAAAEPGVNEARYLDEKALEKRLEQVFKENERHRKRIADILEEDALSLVPCPVCMDAFHGWVFDPAHAPLTPEQKERTEQLLGINTFEEVPTAPWAQTCPDCQGYGSVKTGSKVVGAETTGCLRCNNRGWLNLSSLKPVNGDHADAQPDPTTGPTVFGIEPDPHISDLQARGYTVIAPFTPSGGR